MAALDSTMGVLLIGVILAMGLWGASGVQIYFYFDRYSKDPLWMKLFVLFVWLLDTTHQALISHSVYIYLVTEYGNASYLMVIEVTLLIEVLFNALVVFFVQCFFIMRIWRLSQKSILTCLVLVLLVAASIVLSCIYVYKALQLGSFAELPTIYSLNRSINVLSMVADLAIALCLIWLLHRSRTGFKRSDSMINRLIMFTMNTGLLTAINAVATLIANVVAGDTFIYILFYVCTSRLYTNSLLAALNSRRGMNAIDESTGDQSFSLSHDRFRSRAVELDTPSAKSNQHAVSIKVNTQTETLRDIEDGNVKNGTASESDMDVSYQYGDAKSGVYHLRQV